MSQIRTPIPGFVDLQVNGYLGVDFSSPDLTEHDFVRICRALLAQGTAAFLPTLITSPVATYERNLPMIASIMDREEFRGRLLGFHIEGPFLSPEPGARGAHRSEYMPGVDLALAERIFDWADGKVRLLTVAAELPGVDALIRMAKDRGAAVSIGHSLFTEQDLDRASAAGATALTHLGNGLPNLLDRHRNPIWAGLADDRYVAMLITDGHHLPASLIKTAVRAKGASRIIVVSDASALAGMPPGRYEVGGLETVLEESGRLYIPARQCLFGSSATMVECMNYLAGLDLLNLDELLAAGFYNPLRLVDLEPDVVAVDHQLLYDTQSRTFTVDPFGPHGGVRPGARTEPGTRRAS